MGNKIWMLAIWSGKSFLSYRASKHSLGLSQCQKTWCNLFLSFIEQGLMCGCVGRGVVVDGWRCIVTRRNLIASQRSQNELCRKHRNGCQKLSLQCNVREAPLQEDLPCHFWKYEHLSGERLLSNLCSNFHLTLSDSIPKERRRLELLDIT